MAVVYRVTFGSLVKEGGFWNPDGMRANEVREFQTMDEAALLFDAIDLRGGYRTELASSSYEAGMRDRGYYAELETVDGDLIRDTKWKQWTGDDEALWSNHYEGWYRVNWSDAPAWEAVWCECQSDVDDMVDTAMRNTTDTHVGFVEYMGDDDAPDETSE